MGQYSSIYITTNWQHFFSQSPLPRHSPATRIVLLARCTKDSGHSFANVVSGWTVQDDQSQTDKSKLKASDLQVAAVTTTGSATRAFSMTHKMGLAQISMNTWNNVKNFIFYIASPAAAKDENYTWDNLAYTDVTSSSSYSSSSPKPLIDTYHWYIMKGSTTFTTDATVTGAATYTGQGVSGTISADIRNNNGWTKALASVSGAVTKYTADISAKNYLSRIPYTVAYGDALYSDGALSKTTANGCFWSSRTAIAYVSSIGKGGDHGYAMALRSAGTHYWSPSNTLDSPLPNKNCQQALQDYAGYSNTQTLVNAANSSTNYPGAYAAWNYNARNKANTANIGLTDNLSSRHWFLPSAGQLRDIIVNIVGLAATPGTYLTTDVTWTDTNGSILFYQKNNAILARFTSAGYSINKYTEALSSSDQSACLLASTEYSAAVGFHTHPFDNNALWLCNASSPTDHNDCKNGHKKTARPCIAF